MSEIEQAAMKYFHAYRTEMHYTHNRNRCWWGHLTREQYAEWERRLRLWYEAAGEQMP